MSKYEMAMDNVSTDRRPVRVLQIVAAPGVNQGQIIGVNGPERRAANLIKRWRGCGIVPIVCYSSRGRLWELFLRSGELILDFDFPSKFAFHQSLRIARIVVQHRVDVIHTQGPASLDLISGIAATLTGKALVVTRPVMIRDMVTVSARRLSAYQVVDLFTLRRCDRVVTVSRGGADALADVCPRAREKTTVIYNGVDLNRFRSCSMTRTQGAGRDRLIVGMVAQLTEQKGWPDFLALVEHLKDEIGDNVLGLIVGDGPLRAQLETQVRERKLDDCVEFTGFQADVTPMLSRMDIFVFTSRWEGLSVAIIEAMASGLPIVATDVGATREQVRHGENGFLIDPGDQPGMFAAVEKLAKSSELRSRMGKCSGEIAAALFSEDRMLEAYAEIYKSVKR